MSVRALTSTTGLSGFSKAKRHAEAFMAAYGSLKAACNACYQAAGRGHDQVSTAHGRLGVAHGAAHDGMNARHQLVPMKGLRQVPQDECQRSETRPAFA